MALLAVLSLAVSVTVGISLGGVAQAKKGKGGGGTKTISKGGGPIADAKNNCPDVDADGFKDCSGNGATEVQDGITTSKIVVGRKFASAKIKDLNVRVDINHADIGDLDVYLTSPSGGFVRLYNGVTNNATPLPPGTFNTKLGPTTFDDQAALAINDTASLTDPFPQPSDGAEAFAPYAGNYKPTDGTLASLGGKLLGTWVLVIRDFDSFDGSAADTEGVQVGSLVNWKLIAQLKGGGGKKKK